MSDTFEHHTVPTNGIRLHVVTAGPKDGPLLIFLHGFPECWMGWSRQIEHFANLGYRVLAPDQRGYNLSDKPAAVADYCLDLLADDVIGLIEWAGRRKTFLVGHDWGASVSWHVAAKAPERVEKLVILNVPHSHVMKKNLASNHRQMRKSWYIFVFQLPRLPEWMLSRKQARSLETKLKKTGAFSQEELTYYKQAWQQPGAIHGMINWYRAALQKPPKPTGRALISPPTLIIWGMNDLYLQTEMAAQSLNYCAQGKLELIEDATHWVQHEKPERVNSLIQSFISA